MNSSRNTSSRDQFWDTATAPLGDFTATSRMLTISAIAIAVGVLSAFVAAGLLKLIALASNIFFFGRLSTVFTSPTGHHLGIWVIGVPVIGGLIIGVMARYGSDRIRGHGIPEALEAILIRGSRIEPKVAVLKPVSAAISIGSGGPFGAEGPIIMTGGAVGSLLAQFLHLTSAERKTLLVAGAAAGMSATFNSPLAAVVLAIELLLFEWKPRSVIPVALASATAAAVRFHLIGAAPLFEHLLPAITINIPLLAGCVLVGLLAGLLSVALTAAVYAAEDLFAKLPIHWMWWPAIGGLAIGVGGWIYPGALGVGYDLIDALLKQPQLPLHDLTGILLVKSIIWALALGSGTSGGVLAPLLMMGGALGGLEARFLPDEGAGFWPLISMGAILGGTMRVPITGVVFALELTHDTSAVLPLIVSVTVAYAVTVLVLRRSILTEKVSRRGYHVSREYAIDPLEILFVREVVRSGVVTLGGEMTVAQAAAFAELEHPHGRRQRLYPVVDEQGGLLGVVTRVELFSARREHDAAFRPVSTIVREPVVAFQDEPLRAVVYRMAETGLTRFPVVDRSGPQRFVGFVGLQELLTARTRVLEAEQRRERIFALPRIMKAWGA
jgi:H+/Cl- antiporter ClcA/CBS domain-containing protein